MSHQFVSLTLNNERQFIVTGNKPETMGEIAMCFLANEGTRYPSIGGFYAWNMDLHRGFRQLMSCVQQHLTGLGHTTAANGYIAITVDKPKLREAAQMLEKYFSHCYHPSFGYAFTPVEIERLLGSKIVP